MNPESKRSLRSLFVGQPGGASMASPVPCAGSEMVDRADADGLAGAARAADRLLVHLEGLGLDVVGLDVVTEALRLDAAYPYHTQPLDQPRETAGQSRYDPLRVFWLERRGEPIALSFAEIETVLDASLPTSAYERHSWWHGQDPRFTSQSRAWLGADLTVASVDLPTRRVQTPTPR